LKALNGLLHVET